MAAQSNMMCVCVCVCVCARAHAQVCPLLLETIQGTGYPLLKPQ